MCLLKLIYFSSTKGFFYKKRFKKCKYFTKIIIFLVNNRVVLAFLVKYIDIKLRFRKIIYIIKTFILLFNTTLANFFFVNKFYIFGNWQNLGYIVGTLYKFFFLKN